MPATYTIDETAATEAPPTARRSRSRNQTPKVRTLPPVQEYHLTPIANIEMLLRGTVQEDIPIRRASGRIVSHINTRDPESVTKGLALLTTKPDLVVMPIRHDRLEIHYGTRSICIGTQSRSRGQVERTNLGYLRDDLAAAERTRVRSEDMIATPQLRINEIETRLQLPVPNTKVLLADVAKVVRESSVVLAVADPGTHPPSLFSPITPQSVGILFMPVMFNGVDGTYVPSTPTWFSISARSPYLRMLRTSKEFPLAHPHSGTSGDLCMGNAYDTLQSILTIGNFRSLLWFISAYRLGWNPESEVRSGWGITGWGLWNMCREGRNPWHGVWDGETYQHSETGELGHWTTWLPASFAEPDNVPYIMHVVAHMRGRVRPDVLDVRELLREAPPCAQCGREPLGCPCHSQACVDCQHNHRGGEVHEDHERYTVDNEPNVVHDATSGTSTA